MFFKSQHVKNLELEVESLKKQLQMLRGEQNGFKDAFHSWVPFLRELRDKGNSNTITVSSTDVKWGTKKDGTPRKKPGRKPAREVFNKGDKK